MSSNQPDAIDLDLLRGLADGLPEPAHELVLRVALGYELLLQENEQLRQAPVRPDDRSGGGVAAGRLHEDPDKLARALLGAAQRFADELRESARRDSELTLRKARTRARKIERDVTTAKASAEEELGELEALRREIRNRIRSSLASLDSILPDRAPEIEQPGTSRPAHDGPDNPSVSPAASSDSASSS